LDNINTANARRQYERLRNLSDSSGGRGVSQQDVDNAKAALDTATARAAADGAQLMLLRQQLIDAQLVAPLDATVRTRIMEPGEIAAPQKPVFSLAIINPKWISVYVSETDLGKVHPGMVASVLVDSFPNRRFAGWVGFISPAAEFTPKNIETDDLRTSLVYEVRVFVKDPKDELRLGMPATAHLALAHTPARSGAGNQK
jgi:HlyD family secretion protein